MAPGNSPKCGRSPHRGCQPSAAVSRPRGGPSCRGDSTQRGQPRAPGEVSLGDRLPGGRNRSAGRGWRHRDSPGWDGMGRELAQEHAAAAAFLTAGPCFKPPAAVFVEGVQRRLPARGAGMSLEQERPVLPNSTPTGSQIISVTLLGAFQCTAPSRCVAAPAMADACADPLLGDLSLAEVALGKPPACESPAKRSHLSSVCCWVALGWDERCCERCLSRIGAGGSAPPCPLPWLGRRRGALGAWSVPARSKVLRNYSS